MTLTNRVSRFFLVALAVILIVYASLLYGLARYSLNREFDQQLRGALNTLVAAIEVESDDVKWEPSDHTVSLGNERDSDEVRWVVVNEAEKVVDKSANLPHSPEDRLVLGHARQYEVAGPRVPDWRFLQARLAAPSPKPKAERDLREHAVLIVTVARSTAPLSRTINGLAVLVSILSAAVWVIAALAGRWFCRKALAPVRKMAESARRIGPANPELRLPVATSGDELSELGGAFNELLDQLFQAYQRQRRFTGDAAHQLRTPLTVLQGQIDVARRRQRTVGEYEATLDLLQEQTAELRQIVESLLFLARSEDEGQTPPGSPVELSRWVTAYLEKWKAHPRFADLRLHVRPVPLIHLSEPLLSQLLDNLVSNAFKYSPMGTPVTIQLAKVQQVIELEVADCGMGIVSEDLPLIFEPFFRTEAARRSGTAGTGLGLALAARIARALQGRLSCDSQFNRGSRFTLQLPVP